MTQRTKSIVLIAGCAVLLTFAQTSLALPSYGSSCNGCHTSAVGTITITGNDITANPAEGCGTPDLGIRPVFQVAQGGTKTLSGQVSGLPSGAVYAAVMKQFEKTGVVSCSTLSYTPDSTWLQRTTPAPTYYTLPKTGTTYTAPGGATSFPFTITVGASTPADYYDLVLAVAGLSGNTFYSEAHFYVQVTAAAPPKPTISLNKTALTATAVQGASPANDSFTVSNTGAGTLSYSITDNATWLTETPASGSTTGAANTITVQYSTASLAVGTYTATISVTDPNATNSPQTIAVTLTITAAPKPTIALNKTTLTATAVQGASPANDSFTVSNTGAGTLSYSITDNATWLTETPASGSTTGAANTITVQYSTASLAVGTYTATISVTDPNATNNPQTIAVSLAITAAPKPTITLNKTTLTASAVEGASPANDSFTVSNTGAGTLSYSITDNAIWLTVTPASGSTTGAANTITVQYSTASLTAGPYAATITVSDTNATNNPQTISVSLTISSVPPVSPTISLSTASLAPIATEGANPPDDSFTVSNSGGGTLNYSVSADAAWLLVSPASGSNTGAADTIFVQYDAAALVAGAYTGTITVSDPASTNDPQTVAVSLTINSAPAGQPTIALSVTSLSPTADEGTNPPDDSFTVSNSGSGTLNYSVSADAAWLLVSPASGSNTGVADTIAVQYDAAALVAGAYAGTITVFDPASTNDPQTIAVSMTIIAVAPGQPTIALSVTSLSPTTDVEAYPPDDRFTVNNSGGGRLNYTVSADAAWLLVSPVSGSNIGAADTITVQYDTEAMAVGTYTGTITVSDPASTNDPQTIAATLTINPASTGQPTITLSTASLAPTAAQGSNPPDDTFSLANTGSGTLNFTISVTWGSDDNDADNDHDADNREEDADQVTNWLTVSPLSGSSSGEVNTITVHYDAALLAVGTYVATITVSDVAATNNPQKVTVTMTITGSGHGSGGEPGPNPDPNPNPNPEPNPGPGPIGGCGLGFPLLGTMMLFALMVVKTTRVRTRRHR